MTNEKDWVIGADDEDSLVTPGPAQKEKKRRRLTLKQKGFVKDYIILRNGTEAIKKNYNTTDYPTQRSMATENLSKPNIQEEIARICKEQGFTLETALKILHRKATTEKDIKALALWFDVSGQKAPSKVESKTEIGVVYTKDEQDELKTLRNGLKDGISTSK